MKQRSKVDILCFCGLKLRTTSQKVKARRSKLKFKIHVFYICLREKVKPKAQKDIFKIHGEKRRIPKREHGKQPITKPFSKNSFLSSKFNLIDNVDIVR
jgi:hypothetical protein